tara:strand:+ start:686 stop:874 length:189 start_codon:yes stop_codon:yes gene_type:complete
MELIKDGKFLKQPYRWLVKLRQRLSDLESDNKILQENVNSLQKQLQSSFKRIKELTERIDNG